eukprot:5628678-Amphidinium_carterae.1
MIRLWQHASALSVLFRLDGRVVAEAAAAGKYGRRDFWESAYGNNSNASVPDEWLVSSEEYFALVEHRIKSSDRVLQLGCGRSRVADVFFKAGIKDVTSVDFSAAAIEQAQASHPPDVYPGLRFIEGDVTQMSFENKSFDVVVDKGTWDAVPKPNSTTMLKEVRRVLRPGGFYALLSFSRPEQAFDFLLKWQVGWKLVDVLK